MSDNIKNFKFEKNIFMVWYQEKSKEIQVGQAPIMRWSRHCRRHDKDFTILKKG